MLEVDLDWTDKTGQKPPSPLFKGEVRLDEKKENKERQVAETMLKAALNIVLLANKNQDCER